MEEVDNIILLNLKDIGIDLDDEIKSLSDLKAEHIYDACIKCLYELNRLSSISISFNAPSQLPRGMSAKVAATSELSNIIKQLGFKGDLSYHQLLYPTPSEIRKILMWLLDQIHSKKQLSGESSEQDLSKTNNIGLNTEISRVLRTLLSEGGKWSPPFSSKRTYAVTGILSEVIPFPNNQIITNLKTKLLTFPSKGRKLQLNPSLEKYYSSYLPYLPFQIEYPEELPSSIFEYNLSIISEQIEKENEWNTKGIDSNPQIYNKKKKEQIMKTITGIIKTTINSQKLNSSINSMTGLQKEKSFIGQFVRQRDYRTEEQVKFEKLSEEELQKKRDEEISILQEQLSKLNIEKEELEKTIKITSENIHQIETLLNEIDNTTNNLEREYLIKKKTYDLLPNAEKNIQQLQQISSASSTRLIELANEWEKHRIPLIEQYRKLKSQLTNSKDEMKIKLNKIKKIFVEIKELEEDIKSKEEKYRELLEVYSKLPKDTTRSYYTDRILEIVKNVKKQKIDIDKILIDTKNSQKEINSISDTLNRTFAIIDELVFQDAKKDPIAKEAYKKIIEMNENFKKLTKNIEEIGSTRNIILNLESKITSLQERINSLNFERINQDLKEIKQENKLLLEKLKS